MSRPGPRPGTFGARLRLLRTGAGLTIGQLAERVGRHRATVQRYETGGEVPSPALVADLAEVLGVSADELRGRPGPPPRRKK